MCCRKPVSLTAVLLALSPQSVLSKSLSNESNKDQSVSFLNCEAIAPQNMKTPHGAKWVNVPPWWTHTASRTEENRLVNKYGLIYFFSFWKRFWGMVHSQHRGPRYRGLPMELDEAEEPASLSATRSNKVREKGSYPHPDRLAVNPFRTPEYLAQWLSGSWPI